MKRRSLSREWNTTEKKSLLYRSEGDWQKKIGPSQEKSQSFGTICAYVMNWISKSGRINSVADLFFLFKNVYTFFFNVCVCLC